jgi:hypothetical protein
MKRFFNRDAQDISADCTVFYPAHPEYPCQFSTEIRYELKFGGGIEEVTNSVPVILNAVKNLLL